jgi:hypothetical protein
VDSLTQFLWWTGCLGGMKWQERMQNGGRPPAGLQADAGDHERDAPAIRSLASAGLGALGQALGHAAPAE